MPEPRAAAEVRVPRRAESGVGANREVSSGCEVEEVAADSERGMEGAVEREARRSVAARASGVMKCEGDIADLLKKC